MTWEQWAAAWTQEIIAMQSHTKSDLPTGIEDIPADLNTTTKHCATAGILLAECEKHLTQCRAQETLHVKSDPKFADYSAPERAFEVASRISHITMTRDILKVTRQALGERHFCLLGQRRYEETSMRMLPR